MNVGELVVRLMAVDSRLPVAYKGPEYSENIPIEITEVQVGAFIPPGEIVARGSYCLIEADPDSVDAEV